jgi:16S rRNA (cytosine967-C5)-methyltransferase
VPSARAVAFRILRGADAPGATLSDLLAAKDAQALSERDRAFLHELVLGTLRARGFLDHALAASVDRPLASLQAPVLAILRLGAYQILKLRVPDHAAVSESVALARKAAPRASGLVNGVLRRLAREGAPEPPDFEQDPLAWLTSFGSLPAWLAERWISTLGPEGARRRAEALALPPARALRLNPRRPGLEAALAPFGLTPGAVPGAYRLATAPPPGRLSEGDVYFQDEGSQIAASLLPPSAWSWDCCAAPGGKTLLLADRQGEGGRVLATESSRPRVATLARLVARWGATNVSVVLASALSPPVRGPLRAILLDAPCSGLGTLSRHPDIRWRAREEDLPRHRDRQRALLEAAASHLAPGGALVYSTCSLEPEENEGVVVPFLEAHLGFHPLPVPGWAEPWKSGLFLKATPEATGGDGFFVALLGRVAESVVV